MTHITIEKAQSACLFSDMCQTRDKICLRFYQIKEYIPQSGNGLLTTQLQLWLNPITRSLGQV